MRIAQYTIVYFIHTIHKIYHRYTLIYTHLSFSYASNASFISHTLLALLLPLLLVLKLLLQPLLLLLLVCVVLVYTPPPPPPPTPAVAAAVVCVSVCAKRAASSIAIPAPCANIGSNYIV